VRLLDDNNSMLIIELNDEESQNENQDKESNGLDEEGNKIYYTSIFVSSLIKKKKTVSKSYSIRIYNHTRDILIPPPKHTI